MPRSAGTGGYLAVEAAVSLECVHRSAEELLVRAYWVDGPEHLEGMLALEARVPLDGRGMMIMVEEEVDVGVDFGRFLCRVYGLDAHVDLRVVQRSNVVALGSVRA